METIESTLARVDPPKSFSWWRTAALLLLLILLIGSSSLHSRTEKSREAGEVTRLLMETMAQARQAYIMKVLAPQYIPPVQGADEVTHQLLKNLHTLTITTLSADAIRRYAIMQAVLGRGNWRATLLRLRFLPQNRSVYETERELALWGKVFGQSQIVPAERGAIEAQIKAMRLGWYEHLALEALYQKLGDRESAEDARQAALRSIYLLALISVFLIMVFLAGLALGLGLLFYYRRLKVTGDAPSPVLAPSSPEPLTRQQGDALYTVFIIYLLTFVILRFGVTTLLSMLPDSLVKAMPASVRMVITTLMLLLTLAVPLLALRRLGRPLDLKMTAIGYRWERPGREIAWGIAGYLVSFPLLTLTLIVSTRLFHGIDSPINPAISQFAESRSAFYQLVLFFQAVVLAPLIEETMFRGVFYRALCPRIRHVAALVTASAVFSLLHPQLPIGFLGIFVLGAVFNLLYALRGSLIPSMTAHAINNGAILLLLTILMGD